MEVVWYTLSDCKRNEEHTADSTNNIVAYLPHAGAPEAIETSKGTQQ
jgi:hypothetical protein